MEIPKRMKTLALLGGTACSVMGAVVIWKDSIAGKKVDHLKTEKQLVKDVQGKVYVVTGANSGIGLEITKSLAKLKGKVYMACRDMKKCETQRQAIVLETRNKYVYCRKCDLSCFQSVREFVEQFKEKESKLDVLINNAGVMNCRKGVTLDGIETQLQTNHMGPFLLTNLLKPYLVQSGAGRVIYMMNLDYRKGKINFLDLNSDTKYDAADAFNQSQLANMLIIGKISNDWKKDNVSVFGAYPGVCATDIKRHMGVDKSISGNIIANPLLWFLTKSAERGAQTPLYLATDPVIKEDSGTLFSNLIKIEIDPIGLNKDEANKLFTVTSYWSGLIEKSQLFNKNSSVPET